MPNKPHDTTKYRLRHRGKVVHHGITNNPDRREGEHQERWPGSNLEKIGVKVTRKGALEWERKRGY